MDRNFSDMNLSAPKKTLIPSLYVFVIYISKGNLTKQAQKKASYRFSA